MRRCELCNSAARMYCESDQASLCWDCDAKVHSANFLVARHSRNLLCHVCQLPTPWNASGEKLGPIVSVCESCVDGCEGVKENRGREEESEGGNDGEIDTEDEEYDDDDDDIDDDDEDEDDDEVSGDDEEGENQVVPWSSTPPPPAESSSSSDESSSRFCNSDGANSLKRLHDKTADLHSDDDYACSSSHWNNSSPSAAKVAAAAWSASDREAAFVDSSRPLKRQRTEANRSDMVQRGLVGSRTAAIVESLKRLHEQDLTSGKSASSAIGRICKLSKKKNPGAADFDSAESP